MNAQLVKSSKIISAVKAPAIRSTSTAAGNVTAESLKSSAQRYEAEKHEYARQRDQLLTEVTRLQQLRTRLLTSLGEEEHIIGSSTAFITDLENNRIPSIETLTFTLNQNYQDTSNHTASLDNYNKSMQSNYDTIVQLLQTTIDDAVIHPLRKKLETLQSIHRKVQTTLNRDEDTVRKYEESIDTLRNQQQKDTEATQKLNHDYEIVLQDTANLEKDTEISIVRHDELKAKISVSTDKRTATENRLNRLKESFANLQQSFANDTLTRSSELSSLEKDDREAEEKLQATEKKMAELTIQRKDIEKEHRMIYGEYTDLTDNVSMKRQLFETVNNELNDIHQKIAESRDTQSELNRSLTKANTLLQDAKVMEGNTLKINGNVTSKRLELTDSITNVEDIRIEASILYAYLNVLSMANKSVTDLFHRVRTFLPLYEEYTVTLSKLYQRWCNDVTSIGLSVSSPVANTNQISTIFLNIEKLANTVTESLRDLRDYSSASSLGKITDGPTLRRFMRSLTDNSTQFITGFDSINAFVNHAATTANDEELHDNIEINRTKQQIQSKETEIGGWETKLRSLRDQQSTLRDQVAAKQASSTVNARVQAIETTVNRNIELVRKSMNAKLHDWGVRHQHLIERYTNERNQLLTELTKVQQQLNTLEEEKVRLQSRKTVTKVISTVNERTTNKRPTPTSPVTSEGESETSSIAPTNPEALARLQAMKALSSTPKPVPGILKTSSVKKGTAILSSTKTDITGKTVGNVSTNSMERNHKDRRVDFDVSRNSAYSDHRSIWENDSLAENDIDDDDNSPSTSTSPFMYGNTGLSSISSSYAYTIPNGSKTMDTATNPASSSTASSIWDENDMFSSPTFSLPRSSPILAGVPSTTKPVVNKGTGSAPPKSTTSVTANRSTKNTKYVHSAPAKTGSTVTSTTKTSSSSSTMHPLPKSNNGYHNQMLLSTLLDEDDEEEEVDTENRIPSIERRPVTGSTGNKINSTNLKSVPKVPSTTNSGIHVAWKLALEANTADANTLSKPNTGKAVGTNHKPNPSTASNKASTVGKVSNRLPTNTAVSTTNTKATISSTLNDIFSDTGIW